MDAQKSGSSSRRLLVKPKAIKLGRQRLVVKAKSTEKPKTHLSAPPMSCTASPIAYVLTTALTSSSPPRDIIPPLQLLFQEQNTAVAVIMHSCTMGSLGMFKLLLLNQSMYLRPGVWERERERERQAQESYLDFFCVASNVVLAHVSMARRS